MTIHQATIAKAVKNGVLLQETDEGFTAHCGDKQTFAYQQGNEDTNAADFLTAVIAAVAYMANGFEGIQPNEAVRIEQAAPGEDFVARLLIDGKPAGELARDPVLADLLATLDEEDETLQQVSGIREDVGGEDEETETTGSVVPDVFKKRYAEAGHPGHCGDWLAVTLNGLCQVTDGKKQVTDLDRLEAIANANDVSPDRVDRLGTATNGWQGRYRMTVRNMLSKKVADKGFLFVPEGCGVKTDTEMKAPKDWCEKHATRTKAKAPAKAAVAKDEGTGKPSAKTVARGAVTKPAADKAPAKPKRGAKAEKSAVVPA